MEEDMKVKDVKVGQLIITDTGIPGIITRVIPWGDDSWDSGSTEIKSFCVKHLSINGSSTYWVKENKNFWIEEEYQLNASTTGSGNNDRNPMTVVNNERSKMKTCTKKEFKKALVEDRTRIQKRRNTWRERIQEHLEKIKEFEKDIQDLHDQEERHTKDSDKFLKEFLG